ncbi:DNA-directed RNA polymerase V subunit 1 [Dorcoceras hygrometricum]|uniref:DNA-directed RNA polymerase V subunit 1 n=1 Tax=Dorcoceras hygrometricum TaxID=472368 RepID=A0A2Z7BVD1_9LAMI|nr:DNA-directed RNA polymerase V subunit 1 [Dorcoceras hygrometricum]
MAAARRRPPLAQHAADCRTLCAARPAIGTVATRSYSAAVHTLQPPFAGYSAFARTLQCRHAHATVPSSEPGSDTTVGAAADSDPVPGGAAEVSMKSTRSVLGIWVYLVTLAMSLFDLQDVCIAIESIATLDLSMVVDLIGIYGLKGPYCTLTTTNWFSQALSVIPRGSWGDVARRSYHDPMGKSGIYGLKGPYCTLTTTNWFSQALSVIPRGSWGDVARRSYHDPMGKSGIVIPEPQWWWAHG